MYKIMYSAHVCGLTAVTATQVCMHVSDVNQNDLGSDPADLVLATAGGGSGGVKQVPVGRP